MARIKSIDDRDCYLGGIKLDRVDVEKDLGILVSHNLSWNNPLSSAEVQAFVISIRCAKCTAGAKSNRSIRRRTSARCMSISRTSLSFSRTSMDFSTSAKFDSLKLTETHC